MLSVMSILIELLYIFLLPCPLKRTNDFTLRSNDKNRTEILELNWLYFNPVSVTGQTSKLGQGSWISSTPARWQ